jgi:hypothetical protein
MSVVRWNFYKNVINGFSFEEEDPEVSGIGLHWTKEGTPALSLSKLYKKHNIYSQKIIGDASEEGISQIIDISDITTSSFGLIFYTYIVSGTLSVKVETLDDDHIVIAEVFSDIYSSNAEMTKQIETFTASGSGYTHLKVTFSQSGATALTCYIDSVLIFEDVDTEVEINPTQFGYSKMSDSQFINTIEGEEVKVSPLEESKRTHLENIAPVWSWLTTAQKEIFESWVNEDLVIIDHNDFIYWVDLLSLNINFTERQVPDIFSITMELKECKR